MSVFHVFCNPEFSIYQEKNQSLFYLSGVSQGRVSTDDTTSGKPNWTTSLKSNKEIMVWRKSGILKWICAGTLHFNPELLKGSWTALTAVVADEPVTSF